MIDLWKRILSVTIEMDFVRDWKYSGIKKTARSVQKTKEILIKAVSLSDYLYIAVVFRGWINEIV